MIKRLITLDDIKYEAATLHYMEWHRWYEPSEIIRTLTTPELIVNLRESGIKIGDYYNVLFETLYSLTPETNPIRVASIRRLEEQSKRSKEK